MIFILFINHDLFFFPIYRLPMFFMWLRFLIGLFFIVSCNVRNKYYKCNDSRRKSLFQKPAFFNFNLQCLCGRCFLCGTVYSTQDS